MKKTIADFVQESNRIEGIDRKPTIEEIKAHTEFVSLTKPTVEDMEAFVSIIEPGARLRSEKGFDVRVGSHFPPKGGVLIVPELHKILRNAFFRKNNAYEIHCMYETLHPFTDGNGRSGRVLWLWMMSGHAPLGFLHKWYYQSLENCTVVPFQKPFL